MNPESSWPLDRQEHVVDALREQEADPADLDTLTHTLLRLHEWSAPQPTPDDTHLLIARLTPLLPSPSPVRQAIAARQQRGDNGFIWLLATMHAQTRLFDLAFWPLSALIALLGAGVVVSHLASAQPLLLPASSGLLAYLGMLSAFRGTGERVLEFELVCPPSSWQLVTARLALVLGYGMGVGFALSLVLWATGVAHLLALTLSWLMPLLLVAGVALLLSLRLAIATAGALAYGSWLLVIFVNAISKSQVLPLTPQIETLLGGVGIVLLIFALFRFHTALPHVLPRS